VSGSPGKDRFREEVSPPPLSGRILLVNEALIAVNKLPGEAMEGAGKGMADLPRLLAGLFPAGAASAGRDRGRGTFLAAVHRLDVPVSGCALFARTPRTAAFLGGVFAPGTGEEGGAVSGVEKIYWAAVELSPAFEALPERGELRHQIEVNGKINKASARAFSGPAARNGEAVLHYRVLGRGSHYGFLEITLITGRRHQIRAQLAALGLHIKGDLKYGAKRSEKGGGLRLHARSLHFPDPSAPERLIRVSANPPVMDRLWEGFLAAADRGESED
jgi:23S rRNA pseudouridine1911/1915/1917 synthase